ncbi:hypothetical protein GWN26_14245, partial [Candidatus Saccharibacteria bacterium]|nr:hypothetical protein [Candidatus Saccharibacteria bacterium]NIV04104.1 hypothetical protein [Calditrichia bacterium]NIV72816.1 hypothetical protein [Calditrichia bacterium]NIW00208.1 hypothetical protein [Candidatus Saccharibacteria bacterium]NIW79666.1 hypothetical protein [Calditrichia bacterium]
MALTPEEEKRLREEIREQLADRERRIRDSINKEEEERRKHIEDRIRAQIREEEEEKFFTERGYVKYVNRHGGVEWLTPEEAEKRQNKRRNKHKKSSSRYRSHRRKKIVQWATNIGIVVVALVVFQVLLKYNPI